MAKHNNIIIIILVIIGLLVVGNNAKKETSIPTLTIISAETSLTSTGDQDVINLATYINANNNLEFAFYIYNTALTPKTYLIEVQPMGSAAAKAYMEHYSSEVCDTDFPFNRHTQFTLDGLEAHEIKIQIPTNDIITGLGPGTYSFRAISYDRCCPLFPTCTAVSPFFENTREIARVRYVLPTPQCTTGACCNIGTQTYKQDGAQPTGTTDTYFCQGTNSPMEGQDSYIIQRDYYCTGQDASSHQQDRQIRTCDACDYCEEGKSTCTHYTQGTVCATGKTCDYQGYCGGPQTCPDGTVSGSCSTVNKGKYCDGTSLINSCDTNQCECPATTTCNTFSDTCIQSYYCIGTIPAHATLCSGDDTGLTATTQIDVVTTCGTPKCEYVCNSGYIIQNDNCVPADAQCLGLLNVPGLENQYTCVGDGKLYLCKPMEHTWEDDLAVDCPSGRCNYNNVGSAVNTREESCYGLYSCTGTTPSNSVLCSGDDSELTTNVPKTVVSSCTTITKCEYTCLAGYSKSGNSCVKTCSSDSDCTGTQKCVNSQCTTVSEESQCMAFLQVCNPANTCKDSADNCTFNPILYWVIGGLAAMLLIKQMNKG